MVQWKYLEGKAFFIGEVLAVQFVRMYSDKFQLEYEKFYSLSELGELGWNLVVSLQQPDGYHFIFKQSA